MLDKIRNDFLADFAVTKEVRSEDYYQERIVRIVLRMVLGVFVVFTPIVLLLMFFGNSDEPFPFADFSIIVLMNLIVGVAYFVTNRGGWRITGHIIPFLFLLVGSYGVWSGGIPTTFLLFHVLVVVLSGLFHDVVHTLAILMFTILSVAVMITLGGYYWEELLPSFVLFSALLIGIALLQTLSSKLLWQLIEKNESLAASLRQEIVLRHEKEKEIIEINQSLDAQVRQRSTQLADKNQELEALSYALAHYLRAPLRAVTGFNQIVKQESQNVLDKENVDLLARSIESCQQMDNLIEGMLLLSRIGQAPLNYQVVDVGEVVAQVVEEWKEEASLDNLEFALTSCPNVYVDKAMIVILISHLVSNAIKFSQHRENPVIEFGCKSKMEVDEDLVFYLRDNGCGFSADNADKIFEPFQRDHTLEGAEGIGIGLAVAKRVVERHGGRIWCESEPDEGAVFYFTL